MKIRWKIKEFYNTIRNRAEEDPLYIQLKLSVITGLLAIIFGIIGLVLSIKSYC